MRRCKWPLLASPSQSIDNVTAASFHLFLCEKEEGGGGKGGAVSSEAY